MGSGQTVEQNESVHGLLKQVADGVDMLVADCRAE